MSPWLFLLLYRFENYDPFAELYSDRAKNASHAHLPGKLCALLQTTGGRISATPGYAFSIFGWIT